MTYTEPVEPIEPIDTMEVSLREYEAFNDAMTDPFVTKILNEASEFNTQLEMQSTTVEEAKEIVGYFDEQWKDLMNTVVTVTGNVTFPDIHGEPVTQFFEDQDMISNGFMATHERDGGDSQIGRRVRLQLYHEIPESLKEAYSEITDGDHLVGYAEVDQVDLKIDGYSFERAKAWLTVFSPEIIDDIDQCVLNVNSPAEAVLALQNLVITQDIDASDKSVVYNCIATYIQGVLDLEEKIPYLVQLSGKVITKDKDGVEVLKTWPVEEYMVYTHQIVVQDVQAMSRITGEVVTSKAGIYLQSTIISNDPEESDYKARIPVDSILTFESLRELVKTTH